MCHGDSGPAQAEAAARVLAWALARAGIPGGGQLVSVDGGAVVLRLGYWRDAMDVAHFVEKGAGVAVAWPTQLSSNGPELDSD